MTNILIESSELIKHLQCPICADIYHHPFVIECGHTFCFKCLYDFINEKEKVFCPICRDSIFVNSENMIYARKNYALLYITDWIKKIDPENTLNNEIEKEHEFFSVCCDIHVPFGMAVFITGDSFIWQWKFAKRMTYRKFLCS